jgi:hypothetical protein
MQIACMNNANPWKRKRGKMDFMLHLEIKK